MRKYILSVFVVFSAVLVSMLPSGASAFAGGDGSSGNPYQITTCMELQDMQSSLSSNYVLVNDIDCSDTVNWNSGAGFAPVGIAFSSPFVGTFDGQGYRITELHINRPSIFGIGLFGYTASGAMIKNAGLADVDIEGLSNVGGLVGFNSSDGNIINSYVTGRVSGSNAYVGGLIGMNYGAIINSYSTANVSGSDYVGGLAGMSVGGDITNSYSTGSVSGSGAVGGLVGYNVNGNITNSYSTGSVSGGNTVGGLIGSNSNGIITDSYWDTDTSGQLTSSGGTGKTTAEMKQQATFDGWDFANIWGIIEGVSYPYFSWQTPPVVDSDNDGILDVDDACPLEDASGFDANSDGCIDNVAGLQQVINTLPDDVLSDEIVNSLTSKVDNALKSFDKENDEAAINMLGAFVNQVEAQRGKKISEEAADMLIKYANNVIAKIKAGQTL